MHLSHICFFKTETLPPGGEATIAATLRRRRAPAALPAIVMGSLRVFLRIWGLGRGSQKRMFRFKSGPNAPPTRPISCDAQYGIRGLYARYMASGMFGLHRLRPILGVYHLQNTRIYIPKPYQRHSPAGAIGGKLRRVFTRVDKSRGRTGSQILFPTLQCVIRDATQCRVPLFRTYRSGVFRNSRLAAPRFPPYCRWRKNAHFSGGNCARCAFRPFGAFPSASFAFLLLRCIALHSVFFDYRPFDFVPFPTNPFPLPQFDIHSPSDDSLSFPYDSFHFRLFLPPFAPFHLP